MYIGPNSSLKVVKAVIPEKPAKPAKPVKKAPKSPSGPWDYVVTGYKAVKRQAPTAASVSTNLRIGSAQLRKILGTGITSAMGTVGMYAGLAAAGLRVAGAAEKLVTSVKTRDINPALDGIRDLGSAAVLGLASTGKWALRRTVLPIYAGFSTFRGAFNYVHGHLRKDEALKRRSRIETLSSAGLTARSLQRHSKWLGLAGKALAPVVGVLETAQGFRYLGMGLEANNNALELRGVVDITSALGTTLLLTGVATGPGMFLFGTAQLAYTLYNLNAKIKKTMDIGIDALEPAALKARDGIRHIKKQVKEGWDRLKNPFGGELPIPSKVAIKEPGAPDNAALKLEDSAWEMFLTLKDLAEEPSGYLSM